MTYSNEYLDLVCDLIEAGLNCVDAKRKAFERLARKYNQEIQADWKEEQDETTR